MTQRSATHADTYNSSTIRLRRDGHCLGQAIRMGVLASALLLACNHERVDLGGLGAGGSTVVPETPKAVSSRVPELPDDMFLRATQAFPTVSRSPRKKPSFADLSTLSELVPPISGGTLAVVPDGSKAVAADSERDLVYLIDLAASSTQKVVLPPGSEPGRVVLDDQGQAHVALRSAGQLARIALESGSVELSEPVCQYPRGLAFSASTSSVHVACADGQLVQLSAATHEVLQRTHSGTSDLRDVVIDGRGQLVVSRFRDASIWTPGRAPSEIVLPKLPWPSLDVEKASTEPADWLTTQATFAFRTALAGDGSLWMLHQRAQLDPLVDDDFRGTKTQCGPAVQPALTQLDPDTGAISSSLQLQGVSAPAVDLALSPSGTWIAIATPAAFAAGQPSVQLYRVSTLRDQALIEKQVNAEFPHSAVLMCITPSSEAQPLETQAVAVAFDDNDTLYVQGRYPAYLHVFSPNLVGGFATGTAAGTETIVSMNDEPRRDLGHEWFHAELDDSRVSCAACHAEGLDDAHIWKSSKGARRTPSLRGGLTQTAPFAWDGEHVSLDSIVMRFAGANTPPAAVSGMAQWLDKLRPMQLQPVTEADKLAAASGKALFESAQLACLECHIGPQHTNNQTVDVGTGGVFQVPSLSGLSMRAPYMHDGCAKDLRALFATPTCAPGVHAKLASLTEQQSADVQAYLRSL
jgi:peptidoglycan hydrolase-like protein with peptidoglycan-binding domain